MRRATVTLLLAPPSFDLWFEGLGADFSRALSGLREQCPWMRWDRERRVWRGRSYLFAPTLAYCRTLFTPEQIIIVWAKPEQGGDVHQLRMF
jgi:hypothetical protein